mmetsp:Transcript_7538/g.12537  ORF Transcript_7538/g.12537 Transcript_7538/m.12537 type:complete len:309 (+) Transcript_7538:59-985(+)
MGAAASLSIDAGVDAAKAKELAGDKWTPEIEQKFNQAVAESGVEGLILLKDMKPIMPEMFYPDEITLEAAKELALCKGVEWNDELGEIFDKNATTKASGEKNEAGEDLPPVTLIALSQWKTLVPTLFETAKEREARLEAEFQAVLAARAEGNVIINYQMYNEEFPISTNTLTAARIDEDYGLSDVMPGCRIRLSPIDSKARTLYENAIEGTVREAPWVREEPEGTFKDLLAGETYYCIVFEDAAQYKKDMEELQKRIAADGGAPKEASKSRESEGCSCLFGNPCMDQYICKDWDNRYSVAKKNGWKGF